MSPEARFRAMATVAGVFGLALLLFAVLIKTMAAMLFVLAAAVFLLALTFSVMAHRRPVR
jgi:hypothetical protein